MSKSKSMKISVSGKLLAMLSECYSKCFSKKNKMDITKEKLKNLMAVARICHWENNIPIIQDLNLEKQMFRWI